MLRHLAYVSPNAAECVAMAAAVRKRRGDGARGRDAASEGGAAVQRTQGGGPSAGAAESARSVLDRLLPSVQTLLKVRAHQTTLRMLRTVVMVQATAEELVLVWVFAAASKSMPIQYRR